MLSYVQLRLAVGALDVIVQTWLSRVFVHRTGLGLLSTFRPACTYLIKYVRPRLKKWSSAKPSIALQVLGMCWLRATTPAQDFMVGSLWVWVVD